MLQISKGESFVIMKLYKDRVAEEIKKEVIYIGDDKEDAFDKLIGFMDQNYFNEDNLIILKNPTQNQPTTEGK
jgi:hypothetical protein